MGIVDHTLASQLRDLAARSGMSLDELYMFLRASGLTKVGELRDLLKVHFRMGHGDANTLVHAYLKVGPSDTAQGETNPLDAIYAGPNAPLRPTHDRIMAGIERFGAFDVVPAGSYVTLRRVTPFAMIGPNARSRVDVGLNLRGVEPGGRLRAMPPGALCAFKVEVGDASDVDAELLAWARNAYDAAG
ncbi:MAG: DUF5655 domain-containing protein [Betaproteobacteria bacterium]